MTRDSGVVFALLWYLCVTNLAQCTSASASAGSGSGSVTVFANGAHFPESVGVQVPLTDTLAAIMVSLRAEAPAEWFGEETTQLMNHLGEAVPSSMMGVSEGDTLYLLPDEYLWVWPTVDHGHRVEITVHPEKAAEPRTIGIETVSMAPKVYFLDNLLTEEEAQHFIDLHDATVTRSTVGTIDPSVAPGRTGKNTWDQHSPEAQAVIQRCFELLRVPYRFPMQDGLQIVQYDSGQFYNEHYDYLDTVDATENNTLDAKTGGTNRFATIFMYLNDVEEGGQTAFSKADPLTDEQLGKMSPGLEPMLSAHKLDYNYDELAATLGRQGLEITMAKTCQSSLAVRPKRLGAVLFYNMMPDLSFDTMPLHSGCPVKEGIKWGANLWVWNGNKDGQGIVASYEMTIVFKNNFTHAVKVYWVDLANRIYLLNIEAGASSSHNTFEGHQFEFRPVGSDDVLEVWTALTVNGDSQNVDIPSQGAAAPSHHEL